MTAQSIIGWLILIAFFSWILLRKEYRKGLDEFNKEQEKIKVKEQIHELTTDEYDVIAGLHGLGYDKRLAKKIVLSVNINNNYDPEMLLRESLNRLQKAKSSGFNKGYKAAFEDIEGDIKKVNYKPQIEINPMDIPAPLRR